MTTAGLRLSYSSSLFGSRRSLGFQRSSETVIAGSAQVVHHKARGVSFSRNPKTIFKAGMNDTIKESLHKKPQSHGNEGSQGVPVFVMLPLDTVSINGSLNRKRALNASVMALRSAGVEGVMVDIWWGLVEKDAPNIYNWSGYRDLINMVASHGLSLQAVMSFHQCGGNVGDNCFIPLPRWVLEEVEKNPNIVYTDRAGRRNNEYVSLGCDVLPVLKGRSPIQAYEDFMLSFRNEFQENLGNIIVEIQVGMGPCGELRYPSYPESQGLWHYPGIGEFQCYDEYMRASLLAAAEAVGRPEWGKDGPGNSGSYKQFPEDTGFFKNEGSWKTDYGQFFMEWYSDMLLQHGERILKSASAVFKGTGAVLSGKVAGIHWHYGTRSHAAELTAGYYNTRHHDGYKAVAQVMGRHGAALNFTCFEMRDEEQASANARCSPEGLLRQVASAAGDFGVPLAGENALQRYDDTAFKQILRNATVPSASLCAFTFLRMNRQLYENDNWRRFVWFMKNMSEGSDRLQRQEEQRHRQHGESGLSVSSELRTQAADALLLT